MTGRDSPPILEGCSVLPPLEASDNGTGRKSDKAKKPRTGGRWAMLNGFVDVTLRRLNATAAVMWLILFRDTKPNGLVAASQTDLARRAGVSVRTVYTALRRLESLGLLIVVRKGRLNVGASVYRVQALAKR